MVSTTYTDSPLGLIKIVGNDDGIQEVQFVGDNRQDETDASTLSPTVQQCHTELAEYFAGQRKEFGVRLNPQGTDFQRKIWQMLLDVPYGTTASYADLAQQYGDMKAIRAVGSANGSNPIAIIIPCHRIIGSSGKLVGYAGGLPRKSWLLQHEADHTPVSPGKLF